MDPDIRDESVAEAEAPVDWEPPEVFQAVVLDSPAVDGGCGTCYDAM